MKTYVFGVIPVAEDKGFIHSHLRGKKQATYLFFIYFLIFYLLDSVLVQKSIWNSNQPKGAV